jgi:hypothetical protein
MNPFQNVSLIVVGNFVDNSGTLTAAAAIFALSREDAEVRYLRSQQDDIEIDDFPRQSKIALIGITSLFNLQGDVDDFVRALYANGHEVIGIIEGFGEEVWKKAFTNAGLEFDDLTVKPMNERAMIEYENPLDWAVIDHSEETPVNCLLRTAPEVFDQINLIRPHEDEMVQAILSAPHKKMVENWKYRIRYVIMTMGTDSKPDLFMKDWVKEYHDNLYEADHIERNIKDLGQGFLKIDIPLYHNGTVNLPWKIMLEHAPRVLITNQRTRRGRNLQFLLNRFFYSPNQRDKIRNSLEKAGISVENPMSSSFEISEKDCERAIGLIKAI